MVTKIHRDALRSELASLRALLIRSDSNDPLGTRTLSKRISKIENELLNIESQKANIANVALVFDGDPVRGSSAIEADFAGRALQDYQEMVAKHLAAQGGQLAERGPLSDQIIQRTKLNITGLLHGSFGFVLEEDNADQLEIFETPALKAVRAITDLLRDASALEGSFFDVKLDEIDVRVFQTLKRFITALYRANSTLRVAEENREIKLDPSAIQRAFDRVSQITVNEYDETFEGELLGLVPVQRRFDFRRKDNGEILQGRVAVSLSADYLERIERDGLIAGRHWRAAIRVKTIRYPDSRHESNIRTLVDLVALPS